MSKTVEFYYDFGSPAAYLAWTQLPGLCSQHHAKLVYKPILIGGIFKLTGNVSPATIQAKGDWFFDDLRRHANLYGVPFRKNPYFIINSLPLMRGALWANQEGRLAAYNRAMFEACWVKGRNLNDVDEIKATLTESGFDADAAETAIQTPTIKQQLIKVTEEAVERGLFGTPTMFVGDEMHFGQDRIDWVKRALAD